MGELPNPAAYYPPNPYTNPFNTMGGAGVEILKFVSQFNEPTKIAEEFWGPASKIITLGNFGYNDIEDLEFYLDNIILETFSKMTREELSNFDERTFYNLKMIFRGKLSLSQGGFLMEKSNENRIVHRDENQSSSFNLRDLFGLKKNEGGQQ